jgi:hypothetical protein
MLEPEAPIELGSRALRILVKVMDSYNGVDRELPKDILGLQSVGFARSMQQCHQLQSAVLLPVMAILLPVMANRSQGIFRSRPTLARLLSPNDRMRGI